MRNGPASCSIWIARSAARTSARGCRTARVLGAGPAWRTGRLVPKEALPGDGFWMLPGGWCCR